MNYLYSLRPKQWIKNLFIFMPLVFGKKLFDSSVSIPTLLAFILFSLTASATYLINDIHDISQDRVHRIKRLRPIASGKIPISHAWRIALVLILLSTSLGFYLNHFFGLVLWVYFLTNLLYSRLLKNIVIVDVFCIAFFFVLRIVAGTAVAGVKFSYWMIFMVVLLALFLGFQKRRQEIRCAENKAEGVRTVLSKYNLYFIDQMISVVTSSIVVVYMLYTVDHRTTEEFGTNHLMITIPFVYYGIFRYLYLVHKGKQGEDPTAVIFRDRMMQLNLVLWMAACVAVIYFKI